MTIETLAADWKTWIDTIADSKTRLGFNSEDLVAFGRFAYENGPALLTAASAAERLRAENREISVALVDRAFASAQERVKAVEFIAAVIDRWSAAFPDRPDAECCTDLALQIASACASLALPAPAQAEPVAWQDMSTRPRDDTVLVAVEPTEQNVAFRKNPRKTHPAYIDEHGRICDATTWKPDAGLSGGMWRSVAWRYMPAPPPPAGEG